VSAESNSQLSQDGDKSLSGLAYVLSACLLWGILPLFMKAVAHINSVEVIAHRAIWSVPVALLVLFFTGRTSDMVEVFKSRRKLATISLSALVISINWGTYVWAIAVGRVIEAALGLYISPLLSVALGVVVLGENMNRLQMFAIALATVAVVILTYSTGEIPWVGLTLACSFAIYGAIRKTVDIGPTQGFTIEVMIVSVVAIPYVIYLAYSGSTPMGQSTKDTLLLLACGPVTAIPLILFAYGTKRLRLSSVGVILYITPTLIFLIGLFVFHEPFSQWHLFSFILIWIAVALYSWSGLIQFGKNLAA
jgi:chloramphenicol-sensitive protein RarD